MRHLDLPYPAREIPVAHDQPVLHREPGGSVYGDPVWDLVATRSSRHARIRTLAFDDCPPAFAEAIKRVAYLALNYRAPQAITVQRQGGAQMMSKGPHEDGAYSLQTVYAAVRELKTVASWLTDRGLFTFGDLDDLMYEDYVSGLDKPTESAALTCARLFAPWLPEQYRIVLNGGALGEVMNAARRVVRRAKPVSLTENQTRVITSDTMSMLLAWAEKFIIHLSTDIGVAHDFRQAVLARIPVESDRGATKVEMRILNKYLQEVADAGTALPGYSEGNPAKVYPSVQLIAGLLGVRVNTVRYTLRKHPHLAIAERSPLTVAPLGSIDSEPWRTPIDWNYIQLDTRLLKAACLTVTAYLTGMRPEEVLNLEKGCLQTIENLDGTILITISGREFPTTPYETDDPTRGGRIRVNPWVASPIVAKAITIASSLTPSDCTYVFPATNEDYGHNTWIDPQPLTTSGGAIIINELIEAVNAWCVAHNRPELTIPADTRGRVNLTRFRRTLAAHIARQPNGMIALATQYGHVTTASSRGYAARVRDGFDDLVDLERAYGVHEYLASVTEALQDEGVAISGPAGERIVRAAITSATSYPGKVFTDNDARKFAKVPGNDIIDNPQAFNLCNFDPNKAMCLRGIHEADEARPRLDKCTSSCGNRARTDRHVQQMRDTIADYERTIAGGVSLPNQVRLQESIRALEAAIDEHETNKTVYQIETSGT